MITVDELRNRYPDPCCVTEGRFRPDHLRYCIGGALLLELGRHDRFPGFHDLTIGLMEANPNLSASAAEAYASSILEDNDGERFDEAWALLDEALKKGNSSSEGSAT